MMRFKTLPAILAITAAFLLSDSLAWTAGPRTFEGTWNNRKFGTNGPLKCVATESRPGQWNAVFTGTFKGEAFEFKAQFQSQTNRNEQTLGGKSTVRGHQYQWTGSLRGNQLMGRYQSTVGYFGEFNLRESGNTAGGRPRPTAPIAPNRIDSSFTRNTQVIQNKERMLFIGNSYMANEGGVYNYLSKALQVAGGPEITTHELIYYGKPLRSMLTADVRKAVGTSDYDSVVITSDVLGVMKRFEEGIRRSGKKTIVFMTWEGKHPGNGATESEYTDATTTSVEMMRRMEKETGATIIPAAVVFHDLTLNPPARMPRVDYLWREANIHQNELGTLVNTWMCYAILTGKSPVGVDFDLPPFVEGQRLKSEPTIRLTPQLRRALQERVWQVAQAWNAGKTHLE